MLQDLDRRIIYLFVALALSVPLLYEYTVPPVELKAANKLFEKIESLEVTDGQVAFVALDFGPNTKAENVPQSEVIVEHLMRRRIPIVFFSLYYLSETFLRSVPEQVAEKLSLEDPDKHWVYGTDWVNLGFRPGASNIIQSIPKSDDLGKLFGQDVRGNPLKDLPASKKFKTIRDIVFLGEFTGLVGAFDTYVRFFQSAEYRPAFGHGCTSITIPEAFIYLDSNQIDGLLEGIAGAAWYSKLLKDKFPQRQMGDTLIINTGLGVAHLVVILFIFLGNLGLLFRKRKVNDRSAV